MIVRLIALTPMQYPSVFRSLLPAFGILLFLSACAEVADAPPGAAFVAPEILIRDRDRVAQLATELEELEAEWRQFHARGEWTERGYFDAEEARQVEGLMFRSTSVLTTLRGIADIYGGETARFGDDPASVRAEYLSTASAFLIANHSAALVLEFADDRIAKRQLNQAYYRAEIPPGLYDKLLLSVTAPALGSAIAAAQLTDPGDPSVRRASAAGTDGEDVGWTGFKLTVDDWAELARTRLRAVTEERPPDLVVREQVLVDRVASSRSLYLLRAIVFTDVSRLKAPSAHLVHFSADQKAAVYAAMEPGDLILTYTAGYVSSVFIPGVFKHAITYVGSPEQRAELALSALDLPGEEQAFEGRLREDLARLRLNDGTAADVIEAVAEGVIFNNLAHLMDTHVNRLLVLRPRLGEPERRRALAEVFTYLGDGYDFRFDFADATYQVCTELVYRSLNGKGDIDFELTERAGHMTLSADDIVRAYLEDSPRTLDFVVYAEEAQEAGDHAARLFFGSAGEARVNELLGIRQNPKPGSADALD